MTATEIVAIPDRIDLNLVAGADIGASKAKFIVRNLATGAIVFSQPYDSIDFPSIDALIDRFLVDLKVLPGRLVLAIAGPRQSNGDVQMTDKKLGWPLFEVVATTQRLRIPVATSNDMRGVLAALDSLRVEDRVVIRFGIPDPDGLQLVIGLGTGIGVGLRTSKGESVDSEGGHMTWQPANRLEYEYLEFLRRRYDATTITVEVAVSGRQGFANLYDFFIYQGKYRLDPVLQEKVEALRLADEDIGVAITYHGIQKRDAFCLAILQVMGSILGQHIRNLSVTTKPTGGIFWTGSVAQASGVADYLVHETPFLEHFLAANATHLELLDGIPMFLITVRDVNARGALAMASEQQD